ncbi:MAG: CoA transferase, partial [Gemmatimonadetes bacterium]|nr:CoA transferase [Gemmatimonadota bacterium]
MADRRALDGMVVLDCTQFMAGPYCTMLLGDMGADVIKVERPGGGDDARRMGPPFIGGESAAHLQINRNKRSIVLDIRSQKGCEAVRRLAAEADVLVENYRPGTMARRGLGYEGIKRVNPQIIYCSISGFGLTGPYAQRPGFDIVAQGMSGHMSITGIPGGPPVRVGVPICDLNAGIYAAYGILSAYIHRLRTGQGQFLEVSLLEAGIAYEIWEGASYFATRASPGPGGSAHRLVAPYQALRTRDGHVILAAGNQATWEAAARAMGRDDLLEDERFQDNPARVTHRAELEAELEATLSTQSSG